MPNDITINFPGGLKVDAKIGNHVVRTDQPPAAGGEGSSPSPYGLFLSSLAACAGYFVLAFCKARDLSTEGVKVVQKVNRDPKGKLSTVSIEVEVPADFPEKYLPSLEKAVDSCSVKKAILDPPEFRVQAVRSN